ncbi:MAG: disulfide bond formation protein B [Hyphomicrobiales bacterium]
MDAHLSRTLNSLGLLAVSTLLAFGFFFQLAWGELPCPLCLLQRVGFVMVGFGLALNVIYGPRPSHYAVMALSALFGGSVAVRQILLHIVPGTGTYGSPVLGLHYYTWAAFLFFAILLGTAVMMLFDKQFEKRPAGAANASPELYGGSVFGRSCVVILLVVVGANALSTFLECGPLVCADNPVKYELLNWN